MKSSAKKLSITLPPGLERAVKKRAKVEQRTMSGILQESARFYLATKEWEELQQELSVKARQLGLQSEDDVDRLVHDSRRQTS